jgi:hypothetical protein
MSLVGLRGDITRNAWATSERMLIEIILLGKLAIKRWISQRMLTKSTLREGCGLGRDVGGKDYMG